LKPDIPPPRVLLKTKFITKFASADMDYFACRRRYVGGTQGLEFIPQSAYAST